MTHDPSTTDLLERLHGLGRDEPPFATPLATMIPTAVTRGRRRRIASVASRTVAVGVLVGLVGVTAGTLRPGGPLRQDVVAASASGSSSPSAPATTESSPGPAEPCAAQSLTAVTAVSGQEMNQPFTLVRLTNRGTSPCTLTGYPDISILATIAPSEGNTTGESPLIRPEISVTRGSIYQVVDPGPRAFVLEPGGLAWFAVGTGLAYDGPLMSINQLSLTAPGGGIAVVEGLQQQLNGPTGKPLPITVTAYAPGTPNEAVTQG